MGCPLKSSQGTVPETLICHIYIYDHIYIEVALGQDCQMYNKLAAPCITNWQHHGSGLPYNISSSERVNSVSRFGPLMSGLTMANFQLSRNSPDVSDWFTIMVMASIIVSLNLSRNLVSQGSIMQVVGLMFSMMLHISFLSRDWKLVIFWAFPEVFPFCALILKLFPDFLSYLERSLQMCLEH